MPEATQKKQARARVGRPATGITRKKISISISIPILEEATKRSFKTGESLSNFINRAIQNAILNS